MTLQDYVILASIFVAANFIASIYDHPWVVIHEYTHLLAAKLLVGVKSYEIKTYSHYSEKLQMDLRGSCTYSPKRPITRFKDLLISQAPRLPGGLAIMATSPLIFWMFGFAKSGNIEALILSVFPLTFVIGGIQDYALGILEHKKGTDLITSAECLNVKPYVIRMGLIFYIGCFMIWGGRLAIWLNGSILGLNG